MRDEEGPYILPSEVEKAIKGMGDNKPKGDEDVPGDVLLGEDCLRVMTQLINKIYDTGEWPTDFTEDTILTPWSRGLLEKLIDCQLVNKFTAFYGTRMLIAAFTSYHNSLKEEANCCKMQRPLRSQPHRTYSKDSSEDA
jgi:hypothetical protein